MKPLHYICKKIFNLYLNTKELQIKLQHIYKKCNTIIKFRLVDYVFKVIFMSQILHNTNETFIQRTGNIRTTDMWRCKNPQHKEFRYSREYTAMISESPRNIRMPIIPLQYTGRRYWRFYERLNRVIDILRLGVTICAPSERESRNGRFDYKADGLV